MEVGEMDRKETQVEVPWSPGPPIKPVPMKPVPIYMPEERNQMDHLANGAVACAEFSLGQDKIGGSGDGSNVAGYSGKTCEQIVSDAVSSYRKLGFCEQLLAVEAESRNISVTQGNNDGLKNPFVPPLVLDNVLDPQETYIACCSMKSSQDTSYILDNANKEESRQIASMQVNMEEKDPGREERNVTANKLDNNVAPNSKELCDPAMEFAAVSSPVKENHNPDNGSSHDTDLNKTPQQKPRRRKHRPKVIKEGKPKRTRKPATPKPVQSKEKQPVKRKYVRKNALNKTSTPPTEETGELTKEMSCKRSLNFDIGTTYESSAAIENTRTLLGKENGVLVQETNVGPAFDLNTSMKQASNSYMSLPEDTQALNTSSGRKSSGTKPEENPPPKRKYVKRKGVNKTSAPPIEVPGNLTEETTSASAQTSCTGSINFDERASEQSYAVKENPTGHPGSEIGVVMKEMNVGLAYDLNTSMKQALNDDMTLPKDTQAPSSSSKIKLPGTKRKENLTGKRKNARKKGSNPSPIPPTEMTELTEAMILESNMSWRRSLNFDIGNVGRENLDLDIGKENMVLEERKVGPTYKDTWLKEAVNICMSLPEETQHPSTSISKCTSPGAKLNANSVEKKNKKGRATAWGGNISNSQSSSIRLQMVGSKRKHSDTFNRADDSSMNLIGVQYNGLPSYQHLSTSISKCTSPGAKLNANSVEKKNKKIRATARGGNISNSQSSSIGLQMVGSKRKHSGTFNRADDSSLNLIGVQYNGLPSYHTSLCLQFPKIQKKRRTEKGNATKEVQLTCPQEDALGHPYASSSSCWTYGSGYNTARVPATSIDNTQTFNEFLLSLKRLAETSQTSTCDRGSLTRIRNCDTEPNYTAKQVGVPGKETFGDAIGALVAETCTPPTKKRQNRKKSVLSSSAHSTTNEMLHHHNFTLENCPLPMGKPSDIVPEVLWNTMNNIDALTLQFRQLNLNAEARDLAFHEENALVPYKQKNSLIHGDGVIVPFHIKKQHLRPKVNLDDETDRVWKLLLLDINSHGIDGTDEDKAKWWEEERNVFRGRADSFIARMHLVQGDRRFSRWKGSVVDSVVGVFLTQNVTDHLSSSAFMSLAARFPKNSSSMCKRHHKEDTRLVVNEPQVHIVEPEESTEWDVKLLNQSVYDQTSTIDMAEHSGEKEAVNSNESCGTPSSVISLTDESNSRLSELPQKNIKEHCSPTRSGILSATIEEGEEKSCYNGDRKELNDIVSSQGSVFSSQISGDFSNDQNPEKIGSCSDSNSEVEVLSSTAKYNHFGSNTSFSKLLEMVSSTKFYEDNSQKSESIENSGMLEVNGFDPFKTEASTSDLKKKDENGMNRSSLQTTEPAGQVAITHSQSIASQVHPREQSNHQQQSFFNISGQTQDLMQKERGSGLGEQKNATRNGTNEISSAPIKLKTKEQGKEKKDDFNWDSLRIDAQAKAGKREKTENTMDSLDWDAVRCADVSEIAETIKERGMNNRLAERIKNFLNRLVEEHESIDLEWLRDVPPDKAKEYLLSIRGLGLKSVECVRLLTLHHLAFPVDTNVGRIAVRLGWVPLQPLPESLQLHLLELYPVLESIQKYLWPRLCKLDQETLYELHYQMITFGKVFCTKSKPNCNACPMRAECRHFASAFASARFALPGPEQKSIVSTTGNSVINQNPSEIISQLHLPPPENTAQEDEIQLTEVSRQLESKFEINICQPIIEEPRTPEPECLQESQTDIEDAFYEDSSEIPTINLNIEEFTLNLQNYMQENMELQGGEMSKALVALNPQAASIPMPKLKNVGRLRTEHCVYELPDTHPLLQGWDTREPDDPGKYLLAIWTPGETANSIQPPESNCSSQEECGQLCNEKECFSCNSFREANSQIVRGTLLIPCRTAMRGSFPLNGTYFQVNEVFADHDSSLNPISVPRSWIWNLNRRTVYFGTSVTTIFKGLTTQETQQCFWRGWGWTNHQCVTHHSISNFQSNHGYRCGPEALL
ncbi:DNA glycosylase/AP lyase ROS1-like isoform X2 [Glycine soja]|uniref:Protein ROS1 isoform C n=1 Tax=Glycine soja TaxID=3848 RepID=A0A445IIR0_GLYSO|nr:DNA glycosylase/AP lyase ROS1 isoform X2 [Glycine max]XP_028186002.1 DNA glycosylase/AP lyase ROS1-like isoform X2 [Glycine soja]RZB86024.1 Protein ROS1 isoform C [Glycine soja]|eukprot:XP_006588822.1 protein ROS1 isoform X2 [Glycine max]